MQSKIAALLLCLAVVPLTGYAEGNSNWLEADSMTGSWGGVRDSMEEQGVTAEFVYTGESVRNFSGGAFNRAGSTYQDNLDLMLTVDSEKLGMWSGGTLFVHGLRTNGGDPSAMLIGDLQTASNIEAPNQFIVHQAWYEQQFMDGQLAILAGLHDLNSDFYASEYGGLFLNSSFGIGPDVSGNVATSLFPKAALGVRIKIQPAEGFYLQGAVYDGDPSTRKMNTTEGKMFIAEAGVSVADGSYKVGYWQHTANITTASGAVYRSDYGLYGVVDQPLLELQNGSKIGAFMQYGWVPASRNDSVTAYVGGGVHVQGLMPSRADDELGLAIARASTHLSAETTLEFTYHAVLTPWLALQPSFQLIDNPGGDAAIRTAKVGLLRFEVSL
ncbi:MAG: carbohydrate porin [Mariprofundus sp.]|nr:carbohydrate porin [Mariprofundus sp.]